MKRLFCLALVLLMLLPLFSVTASASEDTATVTVNIFYLKGRYYGTYTFTMGNQPKVMHAILSEEKKHDLERVTLSTNTLRKYFPHSYTPQQMETTILKLLESWQRKRHRNQKR